MFSSHVWTSLIRQKELAKDQGEWNLCPSPSLFSAACLFHALIHYQVFTLSFPAHLPLLFAALSCSPVLLVIRLSLYSCPVFIPFTLDLSSPFPVLPYCLILSTSHYSHQVSTSLFFFLTENGIFLFPLLKHLITSKRFLLPFFSFLFPLLSNCQAVSLRRQTLRSRAMQGIQRTCWWWQLIVKWRFKAKLGYNFFYAKVGFELYSDTFPSSWFKKY